MPGTAEMIVGRSPAGVESEASFSSGWFRAEVRSIREVAREVVAKRELPRDLTSQLASNWVR